MNNLSPFDELKLTESISGMHMSSDIDEKEWPTFCRSEETFIFPIIQANEIYGMQMFFGFFVNVLM